MKNFPIIRGRGRGLQEQQKGKGARLSLTTALAIQLVTIGLTQQAFASSGLSGNPIDIGATLDMAAEAPLADMKNSEFVVRALELNIGAPVDPYFHMLTTIAWEGGEFDVEEAWASVILPANLKFQFGRELIPFGYLNRIHEHDFPQVDQPYVLEGLITDAGLVGDGGHLEWMAPLINPTLTLSAGLYESLGESVGRRLGGNPFLVRAHSYFQNESGTHSILFGASYVGVVGDRDYAEGRESDPRARGKIEHLAGLDIKYRWRLAKGRTARGLTLAGEALYIDYSQNEAHDLYNPQLSGDPNLNPGTDWGFYGYAHWDRDRFWGFGYRFDLSDVLFSSLEDDAQITAHSGYLEWRGTEFSRLRVQYQYKEIGTSADTSPEREHRVLLQGTYFIGWHPPHRY